MDLRQKKTLAAIRTAFLELLGKKPLEKITVKELAEKAQISKATFYTLDRVLIWRSVCRRR